MKKCIKLIVIILWMAFIYYMSSQDAIKSSTVSNGVLQTILVTLKVDVVEVAKINYFELILRKLAHFTEYGILSVLILSYLSEYKISIKKILLISFIITYVYAVGDEFHQTLIDGRSGNFYDTLIDLCGALLFGLLYYFLCLKKHFLSS